jgi:predicted component of type VI protein secretion system
MVSRTLDLRIDALLYAEPAPEPVVFDSQLDPASHDFKVETTGR